MSARDIEQLKTETRPVLNRMSAAISSNRLVQIGIELEQLQDILRRPCWIEWKGSVQELVEMVERDTGAYLPDGTEIETLNGERWLVGSLDRDGSTVGSCEKCVQWKVLSPVVRYRIPQERTMADEKELTSLFKEPSSLRAKLDKMRATQTIDGTVVDPLLLKIFPDGKLWMCWEANQLNGFAITQEEAKRLMPYLARFATTGYLHRRQIDLARLAELEENLGRLKLDAVVAQKRINECEASIERLNRALIPEAVTDEFPEET